MHEDLFPLLGCRSFQLESPPYVARHEKQLLSARWKTVVPLEYPYLLVRPRNFKGDPHLHIYNFALDPPGSESVSVTTASHRVCTLRLPDEVLEDDERIDWHAIHTGDRQQPAEGHFHADLSRSMVVLQLFIIGSRGDREVHYLIPRRTLLSQVQRAEAAPRRAPHAQDGRVQPQPILWADWGPQGCIRLCLRHRRIAVYLFDVNPHVARHQRQILATAREHGTAPSSEDAPSRTTGIVEDIEAVLPGVVDPDCSRIPYVAYRFELPYGPAGWQGGHMIGAVIMGMTGFTVRMAGVEYEKTEQTWTV